MASRLYQDGQCDLDRLRATDDPANYVDELLRQSFPRETQTQALIRRHISKPNEVLTAGVLQVVFGGDVGAYDRAQADGTLIDAAERSF